MTEFLPLDLSRVIHESLQESKRAPDGLLHCSSDLVGPLRHVMLRAAGAPEKANDIVSDIILETGTLWHRRIAQLLVDSGTPFMQEVNVTPWLPEGWAGTADWLFWHPEYSAFVLGDLKTTAGEGIAHIEREGIKTEHHHQLSAYWYALVSAGFPMVDNVAVMYFPKNRAKNYNTRPLVIEAKPLSGEYMGGLMRERWDAVTGYLDSLEWDSSWGLNGHYVDYDAPTLAPPQERVLTLAWNRAHYDVKLVPHWTAQFCPFDDELCDCSAQGETKVGEYRLELDVSTESGIHDVISYFARKGFEGIDPPALTKNQKRKLFESR